MLFKNKHQSFILASLFLILTIGTFLRFYNLGWGLPYPFHPDERNMADGITRLSPNNLNPEFYAYGQFPLYLTFFSIRLFLLITTGKLVPTLTFNQAVLGLRFWSAIFSTATIYISYLLSKKIFSKRLFPVYYSLLTATAVAFTPGLIQSAHFGTTESILTFSFLTLAYLSLVILKAPTLTNFFLAGLVLGIALASKISAAIFAFPLALVSWILFNRFVFKEKLKLLFMLALTLTLSLAFTFILSPYLILARQNSLSTLAYEISVAQGKVLPFYTRQFFQTTPIIFQLQKILPYSLGLPIFLLSTIGFILMIFSILKTFITHKKFSFDLTSYFLILASSSAYFLYQSFLFTKWTRFITPASPFFALFATYTISWLLKKISITHPHPLIPTSFFLLLVTPGLLFFQIYLRPDIRFVASRWIYENIPSGSYVLSETGNVIDIPISQSSVASHQLSVISFNFYDLDTDPEILQKLLTELEKSDYIFVPSRRLFMNHLRLPEKYPLTAKYYQLLFSGRLGFDEIKKFHYLNDEQAEETFSVFDHPTIRIYKKDLLLTRSDYEKILK